MPSRRRGISDGVTLQSNQFEQNKNPIVDILGTPRMGG